MKESHVPVPVHALILAAGSSSRLKPHVKQLCVLKSNGLTLLEHCMAESLTLLDSSLRSVNIVLGAGADEIVKTIPFPPEVNCIRNPEHSRGLGNSISFGVQYLEHTYVDEGPFSVLLLLTDHIEMTSAVLEKLLKTHLKRNNLDGITASQYENGSFGPPVVFGSNYLSQLKKLDGKTGAKSVIKQYLEHLECVRDDRFKGIDIDQLEDLETYRVQIPRTIK